MDAPKLNLGDLDITSPAFGHGERIPQRYTDLDRPVPPPLRWTNAPSGTVSYALVMHDPDAPLTYGFTHWVVYGIPAGTTQLDDDGAAYTAGINSLGQPGYFVPLPPPGRSHHHYHFDLYALEGGLNLSPGLDRAGLLAAVDEHIIEQARTVGVYSR
ncbi:YbhB/YbcL family Raf kinase inhibitor-like protein [Actinacidiphila rubida]|uniref:Phospholipid-binding protein, PBP family n=1 Tax=Actinacidiphila rubida TaxID=310780 RepID=A0A1H8PYI6_9ACTN|nr:YbhB/YbcL family Raf kinase inhibitor-like protein [Actinacidiphila rubida]SEO46866.1 phospholipid-binding protein, PBP family [Actinacidiphila rubida]